MPPLYEGGMARRRQVGTVGWAHLVGGRAEVPFDAQGTRQAAWDASGFRARRRQCPASTHASRALEYSIHCARTAVSVQAIAKPFMVRREPSG